MILPVIMNGQNVSKSKICPFRSIHRIAIQNDKVISVYSLDSIALTNLTNFWYGSTIDSIDNLLKKANNQVLNPKLFLIYFFSFKNNQVSYLSNYPIAIFDAIFILRNVISDGLKEDKTFNIDFWNENIKEKTINIKNSQ